jgi:hypothetical protein
MEYAKAIVSSFYVRQATASAAADINASINTLIT